MNCFEQELAAAGPCDGLQVAPLGVEIGLNRLELLEVDRFAVALEHDLLTIELIGRLGCEAPASATLQGGVRARITASATMDAYDCQLAELKVGLDAFKGRYGVLVARFRGRIAEDLARKAALALIAECEAMGQ